MGTERLKNRTEIKTKKRKTDTRWSRISQKIAIPQSPRNHLDVGTDESKVRAFHKENQEKKKKAYQTYVNGMLKVFRLSSAATCQALQNALCHPLSNGSQGFGRSNLPLKIHATLDFKSVVTRVVYYAWIGTSFTRWSLKPCSRMKPFCANRFLSLFITFQTYKCFAKLRLFHDAKDRKRKSVLPAYEGSVKDLISQK